MTRQKASLCLLALACGFLLNACTVGNGVRIAPNSHFVQPNSDVQRLGKVTVTTIPFPDGIGFAAPKLMTSKTERALYDKALAEKPGATLIVDYVTTTKIQLVGFPPFLFFVTSHSLEGTAAKPTAAQ